MLGEILKLKRPKNRFLAIAICSLLIISMVTSIALLPITSAHTPAWNITTYAYVQAAINPIGVGQTTYVYMWLDKVISSALMTNDIRFHNFQLTITAPDGTKETKSWDVVSDTTSSQGYSFTPTQVGTYTFKFDFPGQTYTWSGDYQNDTYSPSSATTTLTVQQDAIPYVGQTPLPTEYWTRPIYGENPEWYIISSNWLGSGVPGYGLSNAMWSPNNVYASDAVGSQTNHVMWTKTLLEGGIVGGNGTTTQGSSYSEGSAYLGKYSNPIILDGYLYYTEPISFSGTSNGPTDCVDLATGKLIWSRTDVPALSFGYIYDVETPNQHGVYQAILFTSNFARAFDAYTGNALFNVTGVPTGIVALGPSGEHLRYTLTNKGNITNPNYYLSQWNSTNLWSWASIYPAASGTVDGSATSRYDWNVSMSGLNTATSTVSIVAVVGNIALCMAGSYPSGGGALTTVSSKPYTYYAVNINPAKGGVGTILWHNTLSQPSGNMTVLYGGADTKNGVFVENYKETMQFVGYSLSTGAKLWGPVGNQSALSYYNYDTVATGPNTQCADGKLYSTGMGGIVYCYDTSNGNLLWTYGNGGVGNSTNSGFEVPGNYPLSIYAIGNGIIYIDTHEHTVNSPIYKNALTYAINATDGTEIWTLSADSNNAVGAIADGYSTILNGYDNKIYVMGKGPSQTTVSAPTLSVTIGNSVLIQGSVTDISAGTQQNEQTARFPDGVPVSSDASMKDWMGYVYQQQVKPTDFKGVQVTLSVLDSNGNYRVIGTANTDSTGHYSFVWTPDILGKYDVTATFAGTQAYWPSAQETTFNIQDAAATATPQPTQAPSIADLYFLPISIVIIIAIFVVGAATILVQRKKP
jgi:outer membrane protein assembly factor BamB